MKKFRMVLAIALIATICAVFLTACSNYSGDPEKDKKTLEDKGYEVTVMEMGEVTYLNALKSNFKFEDLLNEDKINDLKIEAVSIAYFKDNDAAKQAYDEAKKELEEEDEAIRKAAKISKKGNMVVSETKLTGREAFEFMGRTL